MLTPLMVGLLTLAIHIFGGHRADYHNVNKAKLASIHTVAIVSVYGPAEIGTGLTQHNPLQSVYDDTEKEIVDTCGDLGWKVVPMDQTRALLLSDFVPTQISQMKDPQDELEIKEDVVLLSQHQDVAVAAAMAVKAAAGHPEMFKTGSTLAAISAWCKLTSDKARPYTRSYVDGNADTPRRPTGIALREPCAASAHTVHLVELERHNRDYAKPKWSESMRKAVGILTHQLGADAYILVKEDCWRITNAGFLRGGATGCELYMTIGMADGTDLFDENLTGFGSGFGFNLNPSQKAVLSDVGETMRGLVALSFLHLFGKNPR